MLAFFSGEVICDAPPAQALVDPKVRELVIGDTHTTEEEKKRAYPRLVARLDASSKYRERRARAFADE